MPWKTSNVSEQRFQFVVLASRKQQSLAALCREFGISRQTGYVWLKRFQQDGLAGVKEHSRRPQRSPRQVHGEVVEAVLALRRARPDWGAHKLQQLLQREHPHLPKVALSTVHRILERGGLIDDADRHPPAPERFERAQANELWQMDFKGPQGFNQAIGPLSILDDHSRYLVLLKHVGSTQMVAVRAAMCGAFAHAGLPETLLFDHGIPWWNPASPIGWSELTVWILRQGIRVAYSGFRHPQTQGKVERMHGSLERAVRKRRRSLADQSWLDEFRDEYNHVRPHAALAMQTPSLLWQPSPRRFDPNPPDWSYAAGLERVRLSREGQLQWNGRRWDISRALRHQVVGLEQIEQRVLVYFCKTVMREIDLRTGKISPLQRSSSS